MIAVQDADTTRSEDISYRLLVDAIADYALFMLDPLGQVANWNAGAERIKGYNRSEIIGRHFSLFYTEEDRATGLPARALRTAAFEGRFEHEGWRVRKDGSRFWAHVIIDPVRDQEGRIIGFAKITRDITERREAQLALDAAREALVQSQKLEAVGQLTGGVAHDFNNLLMAIIGSLELVRKRLPTDPKILPLLDTALQAAERGATLTQRMLAFARKQTLKFEAVDLRTLVEGVTGLLGQAMGPSITIKAEIPRDLPRVHTDPAQLETALLNLAVNARDAMPHGGVITIRADAATVEPGATSGLAPGEYVRLSVADSGQGMDEETLTRAMEPFFTTKGVGKGTGLGLSMVHGLAEQSGGRLNISSAIGEGTVVELWQPKAEAGLHLRDAGSRLLEQVAVEPLSILAVDDDDLVLRSTIAMLEDLGHQAFAASSADEALTLLDREAIDVVVTDYAMPKTSGVQLAQAIRARRPSVPVILATGYADLGSGVADDLPRLAKPFLQHQLAAAIGALVSARLHCP
ncbi:MAG TPA: ATP-binding protein [Phenylobacterium sp.]|uniref:PAS domain-containing sensor histidine kinase n=1 Tax=Phenylobacterium sp. TaxID=1871053 RepID=UPI002F91D95D